MSGSLLLGCGSKALEDSGRPAVNAGGAAGASGGSGVLPSTDCANSFAGGTFVDNARFVAESTTPLNQAFNANLDGRLYTDLSELSPDRLITPTEEFYIRTRYPDLLVPEIPWRVQVNGLVDAPSELVLDDLLKEVSAQGVHLMECSGNARGASFGLLSAADWQGIPISDVLERVGVAAGATSLLVTGFDRYSRASTGNSLVGASWVFRLDDLKQTGAFLATSMNGAPLLPDHGAPIRLVVPGWYGCTCIKWLTELSLVDDSAPSTPQMREFASRTMQNGTPMLARDFAPASMDTAAMPIRVERWLLDGSIAYRVVGIVWGGSVPVDRLEIRFGDGAWEPIDVCNAARSTQTWTLWEHRWQPSAAGNYTIVLRVPDPAIRTRRLDTQFYLREIAIDAV